MIELTRNIANNKKFDKSGQNPKYEFSSSKKEKIDGSFVLVKTFEISEFYKICEKTASTRNSDQYFY